MSKLNKYKYLPVPNYPMIPPLPPPIIPPMPLYNPYHLAYVPQIDPKIGLPVMPAGGGPNYHGGYGTAPQASYTPSVSNGGGFEVRSSPGVQGGWGNGWN